MVGDSVAVDDLIDLGKVIQMKRPVALLFSQVEDSHNLVEHFKQLDSSFPVLMLPEDQSGKLSGFLLFTLKSLETNVMFQRRQFCFAQTSLRNQDSPGGSH